MTIDRTFRTIFTVLGVVSCFVSGVASKDWVHCTTLDGKGVYHVCWNRIHAENMSEEIEFLVEVEAHGYVGFGLSRKGGMADSDIVTGWVVNGTAEFQDRHGKGNFLPVIDESADWHLISGSENDTHTTLHFRRKLDTCDEDDIKIDDSTMRLIYAYSDVDPSHKNGLIDHYGKRGSKSALLLQESRQNNIKKIDKQTLSYWDVLSPNFALPGEVTTIYWCKIYRAPELTDKNHIVMVDALIQKGHESLVHHLLLYECVGAIPEDYEDLVDSHGHQCHRANMPDAMKKCEGVFLAWGVGGENLVLPENVGLPLDPSPPKYYMLEIHYDNPSKMKGIVDESGFRIYYTDVLKEYDAGTLMIGATISPRMMVPPGQDEFTVSGHSNPDCLDPSMPLDGLKILGVFLHSHLLGRKLKARHFRNNTELPPLGEDNNYDFNYQEYRYFSEHISFLPGDQITMECVYNSSERNLTTFGGESTREEMCLAFVLYYPRIERFASLSVPKYEVIDGALHQNFTNADLYGEFYYNEMLNYDWNSTDVRDVERTLRYGLHDTHCYLGNGEKNSINGSISYPENIEPYKKETSCPQITMDYNGSASKFWMTQSIVICFISLCIECLFL